MSISHENMQEQLSNHGFHLRSSTTKVSEYSKFDSVAYTSNYGKSPKLILSPSFLGQCDALLAIPGVGGNKIGSYFHNSNLKRYPLRRNRGLTDIHYGLAFSFDSTVSLSSFLEKVTEILKSK